MGFHVAVLRILQLGLRDDEEEALEAKFGCFDMF